MLERISDAWHSVPAPARSYVLSNLFAIQTAIVTAVSIGYADPRIHCCTTFVATVEYLRDSWWAIVLAIVFGIGPLYRAAKAATTPTVQKGP